MGLAVLECGLCRTEPCGPGFMPVVSQEQTAWIDLDLREELSQRKHRQEPGGGARDGQGGRGQRKRENQTV